MPVFAGIFLYIYLRERMYARIYPMSNEFVISDTEYIRLPYSLILISIDVGLVDVPRIINSIVPVISCFKITVFINTFDFHFFNTRITKL